MHLAGTNLQRQRKATEQEETQMCKSDRAVKRRRIELKSERSGKQRVHKMLEGTTYQTGVSLSGDVTATEYRVPPPVIRPSSQVIEWSGTHHYDFAIFDLEATSGGRDADICQIAAVGTGSDDTP